VLRPFKFVGGSRQSCRHRSNHAISPLRSSSLFPAASSAAGPGWALNAVLISSITICHSIVRRQLFLRMDDNYFSGAR
jgi:hypothetical protein